MQKRQLTASFIAAVFLLLNVEQAHSQSDRLKYEAGGQVSLIRFREILSVDPLLFVFFEPAVIQKQSATNLGFGGRLSYNITEQVAVEGELNYFPADDDDFVEGGNKIQGLAGVKAGVRKEGHGLFVKIRPGFVRFSSLLDCPQAPPPLGGCTTPSKVYPALDLGGVIEFYPSARSVVRFDVGDTLVFTKDRFLVKPADATGSRLTTLVLPGELKHNPQISVGIGFRF
jgi:hypothetical protein